MRWVCTSSNHINRTVNTTLLCLKNDKGKRGRDNSLWGGGRGGRKWNCSVQTKIKPKQNQTLRRTLLSLLPFTAEEQTKPWNQKLLTRLFILATNSTGFKSVWKEFCKEKKKKKNLKKKNKKKFSNVAKKITLKKQKWQKKKRQRGRILAFCNLHIAH